jgi:hypothetical protein
MERLKYLLGNTYDEEKRELLGLQETDFLTTKEVKFFCVGLKLTGESDIVELNSISETLSYLPKYDLVYRYIEYQGFKSRLILMLNKPYGIDIHYGYRAHYNLDRRWRFFFNSKRDITLQPIDSNVYTLAYFRDFPSGVYFYIHFSCLQYIMNNFSFTTSYEIYSTFEKVINSIRLVNNRSCGWNGRHSDGG